MNSISNRAWGKSIEVCTKIVSSGGFGMQKRNSYLMRQVDLNSCSKNSIDCFYLRGDGTDCLHSPRVGFTICSKAWEVMFRFVWCESRIRQLRQSSPYGIGNLSYISMDAPTKDCTTSVECRFCSGV